ncbi:MAG: efflux RND transporter permease subunit, partial [Planctomycetota bacterium]|nr:efflux RND transporter permease subunit [Planctomycetota bacterium]
EDQGYFIITTQLPDGATLERTDEVLTRIDKILEDTPGIADRITVSGYSALDALAAPNAGTYFVVLEPWSERSDPSLHAQAILDSIRPKLAEIQDAVTLAFLPPPITGLGNAGGFEFQLQDRGNAGVMMLQTAAGDMVGEGDASGRLTRMNSNLRASVPQLFLDVDRTKAKKMHVPLQSIFSTLQAYLGSAYVNDFNKFGRVYKVMIQADGQYRSRVEDIDQLYVRNDSGEMIPLSTLLTVTDTVGPQTIFRFNMFTSTTITGQAAPGYSSGQAIETMETMADQVLPSSMGYEWSGVTYQQIIAGNQAPIIFSLALLFVYLFLAAQYESWSIPMAVLFSVPLAILGAVALTWVREFDNNIYTQIGLVLLIGLSCKSAILIVEFAKQRRAEGKSIIDAAVQASNLRFRAILMTAFSFILGVIPLVIASGAGAASRRSLGTAVFGGMIAGTVLGVFMIPVLYVVVQRISEAIRGKQ